MRRTLSRTGQQKRFRGELALWGGVRERRLLSALGPCGYVNIVGYKEFLDCLIVAAHRFQTGHMPGIKNLDTSGVKLIGEHILGICSISIRQSAAAHVPVSMVAATTECPSTRNQVPSITRGGYSVWHCSVDHKHLLVF